MVIAWIVAGIAITIAAACFAAYVKYEKLYDDAYGAYARLFKVRLEDHAKHARDNELWKVKCDQLRAELYALREDERKRNLYRT